VIIKAEDLESRDDSLHPLLQYDIIQKFG